MVVSTIGPGYPIAPPTYQPPLHNLLASAVLPPDEPDGRWELGFEFEPDGQTPVLLNSGWVCDPTDKPPKPAQTPPGLVRYRPFQLVTTYTCPWGRTDAEREAKVRRQLDAGETKALERALWTGALGQLGNDMYLTNPDNVDLTPTPGTAVSMSDAMGLCADYLASTPTGSQGMIHLIPFVAETAMKHGVNFEDDGKGASSLLRTEGRGDIVVVGSGYLGTGPNGNVPAAGKVWVHCTPMIHIRRGVPHIYGTGIEGVRRTSNSTWTHIAERTAAVYWDGTPVGSVLVDMATAADLTAGVRVTQATAPTNPTVGDLWKDSDDNKVYQWNGVAWVELVP